MWTTLSCKFCLILLDFACYTFVQVAIVVFVNLEFTYDSGMRCVFVFAYVTALTRRVRSASQSGQCAAHV